MDIIVSSKATIPSLRGNLRVEVNWLLFCQFAHGILNENLLFNYLKLLSIVYHSVFQSGMIFRYKHKHRPNTPLLVNSFFDKLLACLKTVATLILLLFVVEKYTCVTSSCMVDGQN